MAENNTEVFQILIRQIGQDVGIDPVLGKTLGVLGQAELFEPLRNLLLGQAAYHTHLLLARKAIVQI